MGTMELDLSRKVNVYQTDMNKPICGSGCLYGSTLIKLPGGKLYSSWKRFTDGTYNDKDFNYGVSFTLNRNAKILEIDNLNDYINIMKKYKCKSDWPDKYCLCFEEISRNFDAFHLTENGFWRLRFPYDEEFRKLKFEDFYNYDAETWIIFNYDAINKGSILSHNSIHSFNDYDEDYDY